MAMIRGDLDGQFGSWNSLSSFVADGNGVPGICSSAGTRRGPRTSRSSRTS